MGECDGVVIQHRRVDRAGRRGTVDVNEVAVGKRDVDIRVGVLQRQVQLIELIGEDLQIDVLAIGFCCIENRQRVIRRRVSPDFQLSRRADRVCCNEDVAVGLDVFVCVVVVSVDRSAGHQRQVRVSNRQRVIAERHVTRDGDGNCARAGVRNRLGTFRAGSRQQAAGVDRQRRSRTASDDADSGGDVDKTRRIDVDVVAGDAAVDIEAGRVQHDVAGIRIDPAGRDRHLIALGQKDAASSGAGRGRDCSVESQLKRIRRAADRLVSRVCSQSQIRCRDVRRRAGIAIGDRAGPGGEAYIARDAQFGDGNGRAEDAQRSIKR